MSEFEAPTEAELQAIEEAEAEGCLDGWEVEDDG